MLTTNNLIVAYRHKHRKTQAEIAAYLGISTRAVWVKEAGQTEWKLSEIAKLAELYGIATKDLIND